MQIIDQSNVDRWKEHPLTKRLFEVLLEIDEQIKEKLLDVSILMQPKGELEYARGAGNRDIIYRIVNIELQDFLIEEDNEEIEDNEENPSTLW